jgi:hypothetical protein
VRFIQLLFFPVARPNPLPEGGFGVPGGIPEAKSNCLV